MAWRGQASDERLYGPVLGAQERAHGFTGCCPARDSVRGPEVRRRQPPAHAAIGDTGSGRGLTGRPGGDERQHGPLLRWAEIRNPDADGLTRTSGGHSSAPIAVRTTVTLSPCSGSDRSGFGAAFCSTGCPRVDPGCMPRVLAGRGSRPSSTTGRPASRVRSPTGQEMTRRIWDRVRPAEMIREARDSVAWFHPERSADFTDQRAGARRGGRPSEYPDEFYRRVGQVYMTALANQESPVRAVAKAWKGKPHPGMPSKSLGDPTAPGDKRARAWVRTARDRGYITDGTPTKGGN